MVEKSEIYHNALVKNYGNQNYEYKEHQYGCSSIGFCKEKIALQRINNKPIATNAAMFRGKVFHESILPKLVNDVYLKQLPWYKRINAVQYEKEVTHHDSRGFTIRGHCDADLRHHDKVLEFKTTGMMKEWERGDFITEAYIEQANAYANILGRKYWEIVVMYIDFDDIEKNQFVIVSGESDKNAFQSFLDDVFMVDQAITNNLKLVGPEISWECNKCELFMKCPNITPNLDALKEVLPTGNLSESGLFEQFIDQVKKRKIIEYDRNGRVWRLNKDVEC